MTPFILLAAVVAGWAVQTLLTYRQSVAFRQQTAGLRTLGTLTIGAGGKRYRGGRAFVALAVDEAGRVKGALVLRGWTTFARARPLSAVVGQRVNKLAGTAEISGVDRTEREASRQAATLLLQARTAGQQPALEATGTKERGDSMTTPT